jgi:beta-lactamase class A
LRALALIAVLVLAACVRPAPAPRLDGEALARQFAPLALQARPGRLAGAVMALGDGGVWLSEADRPMPMAGLAVLPLAAAVLGQVDEGRLSLDQTLTLREADLSAPPSAIAEAWPAQRAFTVRDLLQRAVAGGDTTAADVLMARIGGPGVVTAWLREKDVEGVRVDRYARDIASELAGLHGFNPAWRTRAAFEARRAQTPPAGRQAALAAYLADPRDSITPQGALALLRGLERRELLSPASTELLIGLLGPRAGEGPHRLRGALPPGASLLHLTAEADAVGGVQPAVSDIGIVTLPDGRRFVVATFLAGSPAAPQARDHLLAQAARTLLMAAAR